MPIRGPNANGGRGGLAAVAHGPTLTGAGTGAALLDIAAEELARIDAAHDVHRVTLARWTVTVGTEMRPPDGVGGALLPVPFARGFALDFDGSLDGQPTNDVGTIDPQPPVLEHDGQRWRVARISQEIASGDVALELAAPWGTRRVTDAGWSAAAANRYYPLGGVAVPASRNRYGDLVFHFPGGAAEGVVVPAATIAALDAAAQGDAPTADNGHEVVSAGVTYTIGRTGNDVLLARSAAVGSESISVDLPVSTGELPPDLPAEVDVRIGDTVLRARDARRVTQARVDVNGLLADEGQRRLLWAAAPQSIGADGAATTVEFLGRTVDTDRLLPDDPADGQIAQFNAASGNWEAVNPGGTQGQQQPGQQASGATLDSLIGARSAVPLTRAQARLDMNSADGSAASSRTAPVALPAAAAAGDRLIARWAWVTRPGAARLGLLTIGLRDVTGARDLDVIWPVWDADAGILSWELPANCARVQFVGAFDPPGAAAAHATIDLGGVEHHAGAQAISRYVEGRARRVASLAAAQAEERAKAHADEGDLLNALATDATITSVVRTARWARAWIRAADQAAALAGVAAAAWTNSGAGTPPTGAHWDVGDVPAGAASLWELTSLVTPTAGSNSAWTFGAWAALEVTATNTQFSVDGATAWHAVRAGADRYSRHRQVGGTWGAAIPLHAADELVWTRLLQQTVLAQGPAHNAHTLFELPATIQFRALKLLRIRLLASTTVPVYEGDAIVRPDYFVSATHESRASGQAVGTEWYWGVRLDSRGLGVVKGDPLLGYGASGDATDTGFVLSWHRPSGVSAAGEARYLRVLWTRCLQVTHRLTVEAI